MHRHFVTLVLLALALMFYFVGLAKGVVLALLGGLALEMWFWVRLLNKDWRDGRSTKAH